MPFRRFLIAALAAAALCQPAAAALAQNTPSELVRFSIWPAAPCHGDSVWLRVSWCDDCVEMIRLGRDNTTGIVAEVAKRSTDSCRVANCDSAERLLPLGAFAAGSFTLHGGLIVHTPGEAHPDTGTFTLHFEVRRDCPTGPGLQFVKQVQFHQPICADDSIRVSIRGLFPNDCYVLRRVDLFEPVHARDVPVRPGPPIVRLLVDDGGCLGRPCSTQPDSFETVVTLPPLPADPIPYALAVEEYVVTCSDSFPEAPDQGGAFPFHVEPCAEPGVCFVTKWAGPRDARHCNTTVSPEHPAVLTLKVQSAAPLAGLQGEFVLAQRGLRVTSIHPTGPASSFNVSWQPRPGGGAAFVLFSTDGSVIPAMNPSHLDTLGHPILRVFFEPDSGRIPPHTDVFAVELLASDPEGNKVRRCPVPSNARLDLAGRICADRPCDANDDGRSDVRDLIVMVRCLIDSSACGNSAAYDCNSDGTFTLDDVLCCAMAILKRNQPGDPGAPRPEADVNVALGLPVTDAAGGVEIPVTLRGTAALGGALVRLRYPADRYQLLAVGLPNVPGAMGLSSVESEEIALGFVNGTSPVALRDAPVNEARYVIRLMLRPGASPGGALELLTGQFAGPGGERLTVNLDAASMPIVAPARAVLSAARPNPFARETRFSVDLPRAANVEVSVHDLSGRRVATLFRGDLPAGRRDFTWSGASERGGRAADGVYFVRLAAQGVIESRKVVVLRAP